MTGLHGKVTVTAEEIRAAADAAHALPQGHAKAQRFEALAAQAKEAGDPLLEAQVLLALSRGHEYGAEQDKLPVVFGRLLQLLDQFPEAVGPLSHSIHWQLKWMTTGLLGNPDQDFVGTAKLLQLNIAET